MDAAGDIAAMPDFVDLDFDFDLAADEFCDAYSAFVADAGIKSGGKAAGGWLEGLRSTDGQGTREGSPDSGVTDGPLATEGDESAFVRELERFLMEDDDAGEVACPDGGRVGDLAAADYFGDLLASDVVDSVAPAEEENVVLAAREDEPASRKRARNKAKGTTMVQLRTGRD